MDNQPTWKNEKSRRRGLILGAFLLTAVASVPRFTELGGLSLRGDEDLTVLSARSVLEGRGPSMPSGMPYLRALPFTYANAGVAAAIGPERELAYRATSAVLGTITPAVLFVTGSAFVSPPAALVAGSMLALSGWHIGFSRLARMYSPFLLFFILAAFFFWRWAFHGGRGSLVAGLLSFALAASLHLLAIIAVQFALIPLVLRSREGNPAPRTVIGLALGAAALAYGFDQLIVGAPYRAWSLPAGYELEGLTQAIDMTGGSGTSGAVLAAIVAVLGSALGGWLAWRTIRKPPVEAEGLEPWPRETSIVLAGMFAGGFLALGHVWGTALSLIVLLLVHPERAWKLTRGNALAAVLLLIGAGAWSCFAILTLGVDDGIRRIATYPFPYIALLWPQFPALIVLFLASAAWLLFTHRQDREGLVCAILAVILPMAALGMIRDWGATRYLLQLYPYILLAASAAMVHGLSRVFRVVAQARAAILGTSLAVLLVVVGAVGGHGYGAARLAGSPAHGPGFPDHRSIGEYVRRHLAAGDVVITEHPETLFIYAGQVDYWFRRPGDARNYLYIGKGGQPVDEYTSSPLLATVKGLNDAVHDAEGRVWFVTSSETARLRDYFLSEEQARWLDSLVVAEEPLFVGEDGVGAVFCLNC